MFASHPGWLSPAPGPPLPSSLCGQGERAHLVVGAPQLEAEDGLQVLPLEQHAVAQGLTQLLGLLLHAPATHTGTGGESAAATMGPGAPGLHASTGSGDCAHGPKALAFKAHRHSSRRCSAPDSPVLLLPPGPPDVPGSSAGPCHPRPHVTPTTSAPAAPGSHAPRGGCTATPPRFAPAAAALGPSTLNAPGATARPRRTRAPSAPPEGTRLAGAATHSAHTPAGSAARANTSSSSARALRRPELPSRA